MTALSLSSVGLAATASAAPWDTGLQHRNVPVCADAPAGAASCDAIRHDKVDRNGKPVPPATTPAGYGPADIRSAYGLTAAAGGGKTVAIVDAYDAPSAEADLATYRKQFGLPACAANDGCFTKVNQNGMASPLPKANGGWAQEISLDLDMVSATCPDCSILLVEADSASFADLAAAVDTAARLGAVAISNSYGGSDLGTPTVLASYQHEGIAITASTGDAGYGVEAPASFPTVIGVGGTSLKKASSTRGWTETAWSGAGSGCSTLNSELWQDNTVTGCTTKATADVSAVADPNTGVAVYDSYAYQGTKGWLVFGGTSASSPIIASVYAMGPSVGTTPYPAAHTWVSTTGLNDVVSGSNGTCTTAVWCTAGTGWDGPTGLGTPRGTSAF
ncbi:hypothetical protein [Modestobacter sp. DSM 44400]|uniref:S53 family peptidase n=1 Tax=Modestobacter sp. DSM 44400 TaxID=1550230 RepID=UPI001C3136A7|nr:hypothetical protein [Modestobacter sp. DSM 44400]